MIGVLFVIGVLSICFLLFAVSFGARMRKRKGKQGKEKKQVIEDKRATTDPLAAILDKFPVSQQKPVNVTGGKKLETKSKQQVKEASVNLKEREKQVVEAIDKKLVEYEGHVGKVEDWVLANVKNGIDGYFAGVALCRMVMEEKAVNTFREMYFGLVEENPEEPEEPTVFDEPGPEPVKQSIKAPEEKHDVISDFIDQGKLKPPVKKSMDAGAMYQ